jgi:hypothetical protein
MHFHPDLFLGLQRHDNQLAVLGRVKHLAKIFILDADFFDVLYVTFHGNSSCVLKVASNCWRFVGQIPS